jgi:outer membrane protein assembly factor BamD
VVQAASNGEPPLTDPKPTLAPQIFHQIEADFKGAFNPNAPDPKPAAATPVAEGAAPAPAADAAAPAAPLAFQDVPAAGDGGGNSGASTASPASPMTAAPAAASGGGANSMGVEIVKPSGTVPEGTTMPASTTPEDNGGLKAVGPVDSAPLPPVEKAAPAPNAVNDIPTGSAPAAQTPNANGKNGKPEFDKSDESSSKHKKKKGLGKINPF